MRQNKFPRAVLLTPEEGLAAECQTALRSFGLKKLTVVRELTDLQKNIREQAFDIVLVDADCLESAERTTLAEQLNSIKSKAIFVALARINSREELLEIRGQGFATVLIKPISVGMMEQALSEVIERERSQPIDRDSLVKVHRLFLQGQRFEAERTLSIWLENESESLEGLALLALHQLKKQEFYRAGQTIQKALKINPDYLPALQIYIRISLRLGKLDEAFQTLSREEKVVAFIDAKRAESLIHNIQKNHLEQLTFCEEFSTREGITALLINLGLQLSRTGRPSDSFKLYDRALGPLEDENSKFVALFNRGRLYLNLKKTSPARQDLILAKQLAPEELHQKIDELLALCNIPKEDSALEQLSKPKQRTGAMAVPDLLSFGAIPRPKQQQYKPFNKDEVLKLVFLGKMREDTVPPESVDEWLQMKKRLLHILFLEELPIFDPSHSQLQNQSEQGSP